MNRQFAYSMTTTENGNAFNPNGNALNIWTAHHVQESTPEDTIETCSYWFVLSLPITSVTVETSVKSILNLYQPDALGTLKQICCVFIKVATQLDSHVLFLPVKTMILGWSIMPSLSLVALDFSSSMSLSSLSLSPITSMVWVMLLLAWDKR